MVTTTGVVEQARDGYDQVRLGAIRCQCGHTQSGHGGYYVCYNGDRSCRNNCPCSMFVTAGAGESNQGGWQ